LNYKYRKKAYPCASGSEVVDCREVSFKINFLLLPVAAEKGKGKREEGRGKREDGRRETGESRD
jgi:hypothetical protein